MTEDGYKHDHCNPPAVENISSLELIGMSHDMSGASYLIYAHLTAQLHMNKQSLDQQTVGQDRIPSVEHSTLAHGVGSYEMDLHVHDEVLYS